MKMLKLLKILVFIFCLFMLFDESAYARAGRGQSYRSSSYRSSSSSGSYRSSYSGYHRSSYGSGYRHSGYTKDGVSDELLGFLFLGILMFVIGYAIYRNYRQKNAIHPQSPEPGIDADARARILQAIQETDPNFSMEIFLERAKEIFLRLQDAWSSGDMTSVRNFLSQGVYNRFKIQLEIMRNMEGAKNVMSDISVESMSPIGIHVNPPYLTLHVAIGAKARDVMLSIDVSDDEAQQILKKASASRFTEVYSFTRKLTAQSDASRDLLKGQCPRCGFVPENFSQVNKCPGCGALYNSGEYDWVLSEITQMEEWKPASADGVSGLAEGMSRQVIEDRASYLFWRWIQCRVRGSALPLMRDATGNMKAKLASPANEYLGEIAVGAVDLKSIESNEEFRADVLIQWSASVEKNNEPIHFDHRMYLVLPKDANVETNFADHGCEQCGAPLPDTDALNCAYCGALLPDTHNDWLLDDIREQSRG